MVKLSRGVRGLLDGTHAQAGTNGVAPLLGARTNSRGVSASPPRGLRYLIRLVRHLLDQAGRVERKFPGGLTRCAVSNDLAFGRRSTGAWHYSQYPRDSKKRKPSHRAATAPCQQSVAKAVGDNPQSRWARPRTPDGFRRSNCWGRLGEPLRKVEFLENASEYSVADRCLAACAGGGVAPTHLPKRRSPAGCAIAGPTHSGLSVRHRVAV
jgi:hypothetical protein